MSVSKEEYGKMAKKASPDSPIVKDCIKAFIFGGAICTFAQGLSITFSYTNMSAEESRALITTILIAITAVLTAFGVFDKIGEVAGAGTIVPITGFANSLTSSALESKSEGIITGILTNMFKLAGAVIATAIISAFIVGSIIYFVRV